MKNVYDVNGGYTQEAVNIDFQVRKMIRELVQEELENGTSIEALEYVVCNSIRTEILKQSIEIRLKKKQKITG